MEIGLFGCNLIFWVLQAGVFGVPRDIYMGEGFQEEVFTDKPSLEGTPSSKAQAGLLEGQ